MRVIDYRQPDFTTALKALRGQERFPAEVEASVARILAAVRADGDDAVIRFAREFDHVTLTPADFRVPAAELASAAAQLPAADRAAIQLAIDQVTDFARQRVPRDWFYTPRPGVTLGERFHPLDRVAAYIPGGSAPLVSTVIHTMALARAAGVPELVVTTPPGPDGRINPAILAACHLLDIGEVYRLGGVYALGALAYGTATIRPVDKLVGPGNAYVTSAKRQLYGQVAIDLVAGPSEVLIIADESAPAAYLAADLLAQAEHGSGREQAFLVTTSEAHLRDVPDQLALQARRLAQPRRLQEVLDHGLFLVLVQDTEQAVAIANQIAPEHLEVVTVDPEAVAAQLTAAGAIFLGRWTPESVGDFVAGPSHVLPTGGAARFCSGLTVDQFCRRTSQVKYDREALAREAEAITRFAALEELEAHGRVVTIRLK